MLLDSRDFLEVLAGSRRRNRVKASCHDIEFLRSNRLRLSQYGNNILSKDDESDTFKVMFWPVHPSVPVTHLSKMNDQSSPVCLESSKQQWEFLCLSLSSERIISMFTRLVGWNSSGKIWCDCHMLKPPKRGSKVEKQISSNAFGRDGMDSNDEWQASKKADRQAAYLTSLHVSNSSSIFSKASLSRCCWSHRSLDNEEIRNHKTRKKHEIIIIDPYRRQRQRPSPPPLWLLLPLDHATEQTSTS